MTSSAPFSGKRDKMEPLCSIDNKGKIITYLDFSFLDITDISELESETPRPNALKRKIPKDEEGRYQTNCIRINNNMLEKVDGFSQMMSHLLIDPENLVWIDLSQNELQHIDPVLCDFRNLQFLYLHGNAITDIQEVEKLGGMPKLIKLTLHGNEVENVKSYRLIVISYVPQLRELDFSAVTKADRVTAVCYERANPLKRRKRRRKSSD